MPEISPYSYFFALPPESWHGSPHPCYLFILNAEGQLGCKEAQPDLLAMLPQFIPVIPVIPDSEVSSLISDLASDSPIFGFRLFGFVSSRDKIHSSKTLEQCDEQALCLLGAKEDCSDELLEKLGLRFWQSFRTLLLFCSEWQTGLLARAKELAYFPLEFCFCSSCGGHLEWLGEEFGKVCVQCQSLFFPRQDPSVISLVCKKATDSSRREWLLLAHNCRFQVQMFSLIAGFVDAGETLEQAVVREVWEEAGSRLERLRYLCSQAWPEMHSLMAGFLAYSVGSLASCRPDGKEISALIWLERSDILQYLEQESGDVLPLARCQETYVLQGSEVCETAFSLPQIGSMARKLIEQWAYFPESL